MKFAAIDIGSNAIRLLLSRVFEDGTQPLTQSVAQAILAEGERDVS